MCWSTGPTKCPASCRALSAWWAAVGCARKLTRNIVTSSSAFAVASSSISRTSVSFCGLRTNGCVCFMTLSVRSVTRYAWCKKCSGGTPASTLVPHPISTWNGRKFFSSLRSSA
ncbi:hypothetical protein SALBM311S_04828 [Streptomyces alboniger]